MIIQAKKRMTAAEVRALPAGTRVNLHGQDRFGVPSWLECTVVQSGKKKVLAYLDTDMSTVTKPIRDYPNKYYTEG